MIDADEALARGDEILAKLVDYRVKVFYDSAADVWVGSNDEVPFATEANSFEELHDRIKALASDILPKNWHLIYEAADESTFKRMKK